MGFLVKNPLWSWLAAHNRQMAQALMLLATLWFGWRMAGACEVFEPGDALYDSAESARRLAALITADPRPLSLDRVPASSLLIPALRGIAHGSGTFTREFHGYEVLPAQMLGKYKK